MYRYILITYVILEYTAVPAQNAEHQERRAQAHQIPNRTQGTHPEAHTSAIYCPYSYRPYPRPSRAHDARRSFTQSYSSPRPFIYKYLRYILYILEIYNICVYIMCIYISIGIYKALPRRERTAHRKNIHTQPKQGAEQYHKEEREHRQEKQGHSNTQHNTPLTVEPF